MKTLLILLAAVFSAGVQVTFLAGLRPWGVVPNLILVVVIVAAISLEASSAVAAALAAGLVADLASGTDFGLHMVAYGLITLITIAVARSGFDLRRSWALVGAAIVASISFDGVVVLGLAATSGWHVLMLWPIIQRALIGALICAVIMLAIAPFLGRFGTSKESRWGSW